MKRVWTGAMAVVALGCGASAQVNQANQVKRPNHARLPEHTQLEQLRQRSRQQHERIEELEGRLALMESQTHQIKDTLTKGSALARTKTVVISPAPDQPEASNPETPDGMVASDENLVGGSRAPHMDQGPRPVLRLYGDMMPQDRIAVAPLGDVPALDSEPSNPVVRYKQALQLLLEHRYELAFRAFGEFSKDHPSHPYADNALYWRGVARYAQRDYRGALEQLQRVLSQYPQGNKAPDALLKMGYCYEHLGDKKAARAYYSAVQERFPHSQAARTAERQGAS